MIRENFIEELRENLIFPRSDFNEMSQYRPFIPTSLVDKRHLTPTSKTLIMWNKTEVTPLGTARIVVTNPENHKKYSVEFVVVSENLTPLIGARAAQHMKLITVHWGNFKSVPAPKRNKAVVHQLLTAQRVVTQYPDVFKSQLGCFPGTVKLEVDANVQPVVTPTRRIPTALKEKFKQELERLQSLGVVAPVDKPTPWVSSVVVATNKTGALRVCIDPRPLNAALKRERYQLPILDDILPELAKAKVFSTVDLRSGYWHCTLDEESSLLTTFATPYGRYRWCRLPFGLSVSSEIFQKRVNQALEGLDGVLDITDDILIYGVGNTEDEANADHDQKLLKLLERCQSRGIALNPDKLKLRRKSVTFMGHVLSNEGIKIDPEKAKAIMDMPRPTDVEGVQRLNGFVNYLAKFLPKLADSMEPIRRLTRKDVKWNWTEEQEDALQEVKRLVTEAPVLSYYDPSSDLAIQCDASQKGLGAALLQNQKPVAYASRALTETETRYAQIEKEMLAIVYALEKFNQFTYGRHVTVYSDHKPLEAILKKPLACAPKRLQGMIMRLQKYDLDVQYEKGKNMHIADFLSRAYLPNTEHPTGASFEHVNMASFLPISDQRLQEIRKETEKDETLQILKSVILQGWPSERHEAPAQVTPYYSIRDELAVQDGLIFRSERVVIPKTLRGDMKQRIHSSHMGAESCLRRARECIFWPNMNAEIKEMIAACETCRKYEKSQPKETLISVESPSRPWERIGVDLFTFDNKDFLITVDYFSNYWEIDKLNNTLASTVVLKLKSHFARYGCPDQVVSDNGPQFDSEVFRKFANRWDFEHTPSSPGNSKANGKVESAVKTAKNLLRKALSSGRDPYMAILDYRNTPTQGMDSSPAQRLMNRRTKTLLPTARALLQPRVTYPEKEKRKLEKKQEQQAKYYNRGAKDLQELAKGDVVRMKPFRLGDKIWKKAVVTARLDERSYTVETPEGGVYRRNRGHLKKTQEKAEHVTTDTDRDIAKGERPAAEQATPANTSNPPLTVEESATPLVPAAAATSTSPREPPAPVRPQRERRPPSYLKDYVCK